MRIVGGKHRGRRLVAPDDHSIRPTIDRTREAIFNILTHSGWGEDGASPVQGAAALDAFCGTGALGLEALSRGAADAYFLDASARSIDLCRRNVVALGEQARAELLKADATRPPPARAACSLVFLDPPYGQGLTARGFEALAGKGWIAEGAVCIAEMSSASPEPLPDWFSPLDERRYGQTVILFCRYVPNN